MNRDEIIEELDKIGKQEKELRGKLKTIDYERNLSNAKQYEGKYFKQADSYHEEHVRCLFVYGIDKENCNPECLSLSYWKDKYSWFEIEYYHSFNPNRWDEDNTEWCEITKQEYDHHYEEVQKRISMAKTGKLKI